MTKTEEKARRLAQAIVGDGDIEMGRNELYALAVEIVVETEPRKSEFPRPEEGTPY